MTQITIKEKTMEAIQGAPHQQVVHERIGHLPAGVVESLGEQILSLSHVTLVKTPRHEFDSHGVIEQGQHTPEQAVMHDKIGELIGSVSEYTARAHSWIEANSRSEADSLSSERSAEDRVFHIAKELALEDAITAHADGRGHDAKNHLQSMVAISMIGDQDNGGCDKEIRQAVAAGLAENVVDAVGEMHGVIALTGWMIPASASGKCEATRGLLMIATERTFDDQFQHVEKISSDQVPVQQEAVLDAAYEGLSSYDTLALFKLESARGNTARADTYMLRAASTLSDTVRAEAIRRGKDKAEMVDAVSTFLSHAKATENPVIKDGITASLDKLRHDRTADERQRTNDPVTIYLDGTIIDLASRGDKDGVSVLLTARPDEITPPHEKDPDTTQYATLDYALLFAEGRFDGESVEGIRRFISDCSREKQQAVTDDLVAHGLIEPSARMLISKVKDPQDIHLTGDVLHVFESSTSALAEENERMREIRVESLARYIDSGEQESLNDIMSNLSSRGLDLSEVDFGVLTNLYALPEDKRTNVVEEFAQVVATAREWNRANPGAEMNASRLEVFSRFKSPLEALNVLNKLSCDVGDTYLLEYLSNRSATASGEARELNQERVEELTTLIGEVSQYDGLVTNPKEIILHSEQWRGFIDTVAKSANPARERRLANARFGLRQGEDTENQTRIEDPSQAARIFTEICPDQLAIDALNAKGKEILAALVTVDERLINDQGVIRSFPSKNINKLQEIFVDTELMELYVEAYDKIAGGDAEGARRLLEEKDVTIALPVDSLQQLTARAKELRQAVKQQQIAADKWKNDYAGQPIPASKLVSAWKGRTFALGYSIQDNPNAIMNFLAENGTARYVRECIESGRTDITQDQYPRIEPTIKHIGARYDPATSLKALERVVEYERVNGGYAPKIIRAGKALVNTGDRTMKAEIIDGNDPRGFTIGYDTGCCMTLGGASESCIWAGYEDPRYSFFAVYDDADRLRAQSILYVAEQDGKRYLVADNIEVNAGTNLAAVAGIYKEALLGILEEQDVQVDAIHIGEGYVKKGVLDSLPMVMRPVETPLGSAVYTDAEMQRELWRR